MPSLWIVATPLGNLADFSPRAQATLELADLILAEDTRRAGLFLQKLGIKPKKLLSFYEHNEEARQKEVLEALANGANIALITDAGTPLMADPGYRLVRACRQAGIPVSPIPGPSAPVTALSAAGLPPLPFTFLGFLPRSEGARAELFQQYAKAPGSLIFFERKNRLLSSLNIAFAELGDREIAICRELTKAHEEFIIGKLAERETLASDLLGELTVIIGPSAKISRSPLAKAEETVNKAYASGLKPKEAAKLAAAQCPGWSAAELYNLLKK